MSAIPADRHQDRGWYEIRVQGHLDSRWVAWFDGLTLTRGSDGTTFIEGPVADQAALHGLLQKIRDLGLPLISVNHVAPGHPPAPDNSAAHESRTTWPSLSKPRQPNRRRKESR